MSLALGGQTRAAFPIDANCYLLSHAEVAEDVLKDFF